MEDKRKCGRPKKKLRTAVEKLKYIKLHKNWTENQVPINVM